MIERVAMNHLFGVILFCIAAAMASVLGSFAIVSWREGERRAALLVALIALGSGGVDRKSTRLNSSHLA